MFDWLNAVINTCPFSCLNICNNSMSVTLEGETIITRSRCLVTGLQQEKTVTNKLVVHNQITNIPKRKLETLDDLILRKKY